jgi:hypothetical protein
VRAVIGTMEAAVGGPERYGIEQDADPSYEPTGYEDSAREQRVGHGAPG